MQSGQFVLNLEVAGLLILTLVLLHFWLHGELEDGNARLFHRMALLAMAASCLNLLASLTQRMLLGPAAMVTTVLNSLYFQTNLILSGLVYHYTNRIRPGVFSSGSIYRRLVTMLPALLHGVLLVVNLFVPLLFSYTAQGDYLHGPIYYTTYILNGLYLLAAMGNVIVHVRQYQSFQLLYLGQTFLILLVGIAVQLLEPRMQTIDFATALAILTFYLHNDNPVRFTDGATGTLTRYYLSFLVREMNREKRDFFFVAVRVTNMREIHAFFGELAEDRLMTLLADAMKPYDHENHAFRVSPSVLMIHCHTPEQYEKQRRQVETKLRETLEHSPYAGRCGIRLAGIPNAQQLPSEDSLSSYVEYLFSSVGGTEPFLWCDSTPETIAGFRYSTEVARYLRTAVEQDLFTLAYQPIYDVRRGCYTELEALTRLDHPTLGRMSPQDIIGEAERSGLIRRVTYLQFCRMCSFLQANPEVLEQIEKVHFNLSPLDLARRDHVQALVEELRRCGLPPEKVEFEITEGIATRYTQDLQEVLALLRDAGITLSLDDFGTGYANLSSLLRIPLRTLKMDRSWLLDLQSNPEHAGFCRDLVRVAQKLGLKIVFEGAERREECEMLNAWGADLIQGYYYSRPVSPERLIELLDENGKNKG